MADGGTLLLDEISEIDPALQAKLRALQSASWRVGSTQTIKVDVRIVATTNRDLQAKLKRVTSARNLYYRLNVIEMALPRCASARKTSPLSSTTLSPNT